MNNAAHAKERLQNRQDVLGVSYPCLIYKLMGW